MNKVSGGDRILAELFQILKDDAVKVLHSIVVAVVPKSCLTLQPHDLQKASLPCPSLSSRICSNSCLFVALSMSANLENSTVTTGLEKVSFHSSPKDRQCQRILKLSYNGR